MKESRACNQPSRKMRSSSEIVQEAEEAEAARLPGEDEAVVAAEEAQEEATATQEEEAADLKLPRLPMAAEATVEATVASRAVETTTTDRVSVDQAVMASTMASSSRRRAKEPTSAARLLNQTLIRRRGSSLAHLEAGTTAGRLQDLLEAEQVAAGTK